LGKIPLILDEDIGRVYTFLESGSLDVEGLLLFTLTAG
jgi:hypothetical protein